MVPDALARLSPPWPRCSGRWVSCFTPNPSRASARTRTSVTSTSPTAPTRSVRIPSFLLLLKPPLLLLTSLAVSFSRPGVSRVLGVGKGGRVRVLLFTVNEQGICSKVYVTCMMTSPPHPHSSAGKYPCYPHLACTHTHSEWERDYSPSRGGF